MLTMSLLLLGATSCLGDSGDQTATMNATMHNRAVSTDDDAAKLSLSTYTVTINYTQSTFAITGSAALTDGTTVQFTTDEMPISVNSEQGTYTFSSSNVTTTGVHTISGFKGTFDMASGLLFVSFVCDDCEVYATTGVSFPYCTSTAVDTTGQSSPYENTTAGYYFAVDPSTMKADMQITNFVLSQSTSSSSTSSSYFYAADGLEATLTSTGYIFTADVLPGTTSLGTDTLRNVRAVVTESGQALDMSYTAGTKRVTVRGTYFSSSN